MRNTRTLVKATVAGTLLFAALSVLAQELPSVSAIRTRALELLAYHDEIVQVFTHSVFPALP